MRCYICNKPLSEKEGPYNEELGQVEPCTTCLDIALDAAYSGTFSMFDEDLELAVPSEWDEPEDGFFLSSSMFRKDDNE